MQDVSKILTRKYYGKKDPFRSREFRQPRWMELLAVLLFTVSGLGEGKSINVVLGGLPKAVTLAFVGLAGLEFFIRGDFDRLKKLAGPSGLYILYLAVLAAWSMFIWVRNFTAFASITRGVEKILYQSIATVVAICCVYLYGRFSIDLFTIGICCANLFILFSEVPAYGVGESVSSLLTSILSLGNNTYGYAERLEIHEVTFLEGIFVLYYLFFSPKETKQQRTRNWVLAGCSFFFVLAGMKRILLPGAGGLGLLHLGAAPQPCQGKADHAHRRGLGDPVLGVSVSGAHRGHLPAAERGGRQHDGPRLHLEPGQTLLSVLAHLHRAGVRGGGRHGHPLL